MDDFANTVNVLDGGAGSDELVGDLGIDRLIGGAGNDLIFGYGAGESARSGSKPGTRRSARAAEKLQTNAANRGSATSRTDEPDVLIGVNPGVTNPGRGEIDELFGGGDPDNFILAQGNKVFYNDGNRNTAGVNDFARISNFEIDRDFLVVNVPSNFSAVDDGAGGANFFFLGPANNRFPTPELIANIAFAGGGEAARRATLSSIVKTSNVSIDSLTEM